MQHNRIPPMPPMPPAALSDMFSTLDIGMAPKRKATAAPRGHYGLSSDSSLSVMMIALSRLLSTTDQLTLERVAAEPMAAALNAAVQAAVLRVAITLGGASADLSASNVQTLFNLAGSHVHQRRLYEGGLSLPSRLAHSNAKALLTALYDALATVRASATGYQFAQRLLQQPQYTAEANAELAAVVAAVETEMRRMLGGERGEGGGTYGRSGDPGGGSSSARSTRSTVSDRSTSPPPPDLPPIPVMVTAVPVLEAVDPGASMSANARRLLEGRIGRRLSASEASRLDEALLEALSLLQTGGADARQRLGAQPMGGALVIPGMAQLWAATVEAAEGEVGSVAAFGQAIVDHASAVAGVLFASALGL